MRRSYRELDVWMAAMDLAVEIYRVTGAFPRAEQFGLTDQMRRAATSVPANIAEGAGRETSADFARFVRMARGSLNELETFLTLAERLTYTDSGQTGPLLAECERIGAMIRGLLRHLSTTVSEDVATYETT